ncbi:MAG TPA: pyrroline-5-carboxylate reductase [Tepidisphaeraceae bacterium]|nr:pyrroline-5-carboxylate reductase [Tepidisphaeraceae bacterium]
MSVELGILGAGNMAEAIAGGVVRGGLLKPDQILAADVSGDRRKIFSERLGISTTEDNRQVASQAKTILLSVKPQHMKQVLEGIRDVLRADALIISIAAGISTRFIETHVGGSRRVIRTMPNTPMLIGEGMVAMARGQHATEDDSRRARALFETAAAVIDVSEDQLDAVTAVSGSGPAYIFYLVEQMIRAGTELDLSPEHARQLAIKTALGAARMLASSDDSPQELRRKVTSPGGTTQAAISYMEQHEFASTVVEALKAAATRSRELGS